MKVTKSWNGTALDPQDIASPCGSIGKSSVIQLTHSLMILISYLLALRLFLLMKQTLLGKATREKDSKKALIAQIYNGSIHKTSILLSG
jgi:hypothetical protein